MFQKYAQGFIVLPGGFGTFDEFFESATLIQTGKIERFPIIAMGSDFWEPFREFSTGSMIREGTIAESDRELFTLTDSVEEAVAAIESGM